MKRKKKKKKTLPSNAITAPVPDNKEKRSAASKVPYMCIHVNRFGSKKNTVTPTIQI